MFADLSSGACCPSDIIVKLVMIGLAIASLVTWTVWLAKWLELRSARTAVRRDLRTLRIARRSLWPTSSSASAGRRSKRRSFK